MTEWLSPAEWDAVRLSLRVAFWATLINLPVGLCLAYALARGRFPGRGLLNVAVHLPLIMPPVVTGYLLLLGFGARGPIGGFLESTLGLSFAFRWTGAALAAGVMALPFMVRAVRLSIEAVDPKLEQAAATLGASRLWVFLTVTFPLIIPGILAGTVLTFAKGMGEFGATITFVSNIPGQTQTIPLAIDLLLDTPGGEARAARLAGLSIALAASALALSEWLSRRVAARVGGQ
ncbi:MAG: molybdate ABC transporter permease subunit [Roseovarius sp.]